jgi:hypothetical protein
MQFTDYIGQDILVKIPLLHENDFQRVRLRGVDAGGLWIESQKFTNEMLALTGAQASPRTIVVFFPYHAISFAFQSVDEIALSESAFGV